MTLSEYELRMESYELQETDRQFNMALQAWLNTAVQAVDKDGKSIYKDFDDFFDYIKQINKVRSYYEPNYVPVKKIKQPSKADILINRIKEYQKMHPRKGGK